MFRHARYWLFVYDKLLWILADVGERLIQSPCSGFVKKIMNSYLVEVTQDTLKTIKRTTATQSGTESVFLYLPF
ncbi:hypothetical protein EWZ98_07330 [Helicobacter pylori]|nr:hypothetical protein [Helicobacter pylori]